MAAFLFAAIVAGAAVYQSTENEKLSLLLKSPGCCSSSSDGGEKTNTPIKKTPASEMYEDRDVGDLRVNMNLSPFYSVVDDPDVALVRSKNPEDIYNVFGNALENQSIIREKNRALGIATHFDPRNRKTLTIPAYYQKPVTMLLPAPGIFPGYENAYFTKMDRPSTDSLNDQVVQNYKDPWGSVTPYHLPRDNVVALQTLGNPWGPMGVFNRAFVENANRLTKGADFVDDSYGGLPMVAGRIYGSNNGPFY